MSLTGAIAHLSFIEIIATEPMALMLNLWTSVLLGILYRECALS